MTRMQEWQKELVGLGVGVSVVHVLLAAVLVAMLILAVGRFAY